MEHLQIGGERDFFRLGVARHLLQVVVEVHSLHPTIRLLQGMQVCPIANSVGSQPQLDPVSPNPLLVSHTVQTAPELHSVQPMGHFTHKLPSKKYPT